MWVNNNQSVNMNRLLKKVRSSRNQVDQDEFIKKSITTQLSHSVKEIQYCELEENKSSKAEDALEAANTLCTAIEAIFLHGLKDSLTYRFRKALADVEERPEPSFWAPLLIISHRQIIDQITSLSQITTEVGQCRSWVRLAINDCLLSSYLMTLRQETDTVKGFYRTSAYIRDTELLDVAQRLTEGVETVKSFTLPCNSSLLNSWALPSLYLAGIWAPAMKACPLAPCDDVAQSLDRYTPTTARDYDSYSIISTISGSSQASNLKTMTPLNEEEALRIILGKDSNKDMVGKLSDDVKSSSDASDSEAKISDVENVNFVFGNSLNGRRGWSFDETHVEKEDVKNTVIVEKEEVAEAETINTVEEPKTPDVSYQALLESYNVLNAGHIKTPDLRDVIQKFRSESSNGFIPSENNNENMSNDLINKVEVVNQRSEVIALTTQLGLIGREKGLDFQNFNCASCNERIGIDCKLNVCAFTGEYFCASCMSNEKISIPARIVHNWDHKKYSVSQKAFNFIDQIKNDPLIDFKTMNPFIYGAVDDMALLQTLRNQLNFIRAYLYTCREPVIEQLQKQMWPREYMYEHIHQYSFSDLLQIPSGELARQLHRVVEFGKYHVTSCWLCSQKGFLCEICKDPKTLFPFDVEHVYRCEACNGVYHKSCLSAGKPCPKCNRRKKRDNC